MASSGYFSNNNRGELPELQEELNSIKQETKREAVKKVIAAMTVGKDVSSLFPHVVKCMETTNVELKKLVYLYIINYAKSQPDLAIMAVNSFRKDARNPTNPLIRALAVRTMGCIRVERITEYLTEPLKEALNDEDPYVRKTSAICVAKLFDIAPYLIDDDEFQIALSNLLSDSNAQVVANAVAAIQEINETKGDSIITLNGGIINRILAAMNECTEWGQVFILDYIVLYNPVDSQEAENIVERVVPRLAHANPAVVLSAAKVILKYMDFITNNEMLRSLHKKLAPSLITLVTSEHEIAYVALRCIDLIVQKRPSILEKEVKVFFCKFNDPIYVKMEKLEILIRLVDARNVDQVLNELKDYATDVDVEFSRKSVSAIGRCAIKLDRAVDRCMNVLQDLINIKSQEQDNTSKSQHILQESLIVIRDIFRKYPNRYEGILRDIFSNLQELEDADAKAALIWILGEYAERIEDVKFQLQTYIQSFKDEPSTVQFQILTAAVKFYLKLPDGNDEMITQLLQLATSECANPDLRDRAYIYWRLLSCDPEGTKEVVLCERPPISEQSYHIRDNILNRLIEELGTLASVYHQPSEKKVAQVRQEVIEQQNNEQDNELDIYSNKNVQTGQPMPVTEIPDLLDLDFHPSPPMVSFQNARIPLQQVMNQDQQGVNGNTGVSLEGAFQLENSQIILEFSIQNQGQDPLDNFEMQFNVNYYGLTLEQGYWIQAVPPGQETKNKVNVVANVQNDTHWPTVPFMVQMAMKCSRDIFYFQMPCMYSVLLQPNVSLTQSEFEQRYQEITLIQFSHQIQQVNPLYTSSEQIRSRLTNNNIKFVYTESAYTGNEEILCHYCKSVKGDDTYAKVKVPLLGGPIEFECKAEHENIAGLFIQTAIFLLTTN